MSQIKKTIPYIDKTGSINSKDVAVKQPKASNKRAPGMMKFMNIGYYLIVPLLLGVFGGDWLDKRFQTKPVFTLILITVGMIAAFYNLYKLIKDA